MIHRLLRLPVFGTSAMNLYTSRTGIAQPPAPTRSIAAPERADAADGRAPLPRRATSRAPTAALAAYLAGYLNHAVEDGAARGCSQPVLLAWGREAANPPVESADLWLHALPAAELEVFETAGTLPHAEAPTAFASAWSAVPRPPRPERRAAARMTS